VTINVTRRYRFCASHRLHSSELSDESNRELYGKCNNTYGHGHDYVLEVTVAGSLDKSTGRVCNPATLDALVTRYVLSEVDHKNLNEDVAEFAASRAVPTSENVTRMIEARLKHAWKYAFPEAGLRLTRIRLQETKKNSFELTI
jgi:6-pyruvoyltetrahydropterin/6-carboxytetrahydropterin synthase